MQSFQYSRPASLAEAIVAGRVARAGDAEASVAFLAGGTTLLDLMKLEVLRPQRVVDLRASAREFSDIRFDGSTLRLGAFAKMAEVADHPDVLGNFPVIAQSLSLAASAQLRNMATLGGNVLQRTRCAYFRDTSWAACNKRSPGSGCAALEGSNRQHAVLGVSQQCIATYPGDFAQALLALDAVVTIVGSAGARSIPFHSLHTQPGDTPHLETSLQPGEIITEFLIPAGAWTNRSLYLKIRDRQSYEFAVSSAAIAMDIDSGIVKDVRVALGGVATIPWRARDVENMLRGSVLTEASAREAARAAFTNAVPQSHNSFKIALGESTIVRALLQAASMEIRRG